MARKKKNSGAERTVSLVEIQAVIRNGRPFAGRIAPGMASLIYSAGLRAPNSTFRQVNRGGHVVLIPRTSMPRELSAAVRRHGRATAVLPPGYVSTLKELGLLVPAASPGEVDRGGEFVVMPRSMCAVINGISPFHDGDVVDRHDSRARRLPRGIFDRAPVLQALVRGGVTVLVPFEMQGVRVL